MSNVSKNVIIRRFKELLDIGQIDKIKVIYRVAGGPPGKHLAEEITFFGNGRVRLLREDEARSQYMQKGFLKVDPQQTRSLFRQIGGGLDSLNKKAMPIFLPDSVISSFTIEVEDKKTSLYFLSYERDRLLQNKAISQEVAEAVKSIELISRRRGE